MSVDNYVVITLNRESAGLQQRGFGKPMILSHTAEWPERGRDYTGIVEAAADWPIDSPEYRQLNVLFSQTPRVETVMVGRAALKPTLRYSIDAIAVDLATYDLSVTGEGVTDTDITYTAPAPTAAQEKIHASLLEDLNAVVGKNYTAAFTPLVVADFVFTRTSGNILTKVAHGLQTGDGALRGTTTGTLPAGMLTGTDYYAIRLTADTFSIATTLENALTGTAVVLTDAGSGTHTMIDQAGTVRPQDPIIVTATNPGDWFAIDIGASSIGRFTIAQTHADPGVATDLAAIVNEKPDFYYVLTHFNSSDYVDGVADWVSANKRMYGFDVNETEAVNTANGAGDVIDDNQTEARSRVSAEFHHRPSDFLAAAHAGRCLPIDPGSGTWALRRLTGPAPVPLTTTQRGNLTSRYGNSYEEISPGISVTYEGKTGDGDFVEIQRNIDWLEDAVKTAIMNALIQNEIIILDDPGIHTIASVFRGELERAKRSKVILSYELLIPKRSSIPSGDIGTGTISGLKATAVIARAVHKVNLIISFTN